MSNELDRVSEFLLELDKLKSVNRRTYINGGERVENSAEHSWHLAVACWAFAELLKDDFDLLKLLQLALVHDLGEIDAGDTFLYGSARSNSHVAERECVKRLESHSGNTISSLTAIWEEQETGLSRESKLLKVIDRLLPFLHNMTSEGRAWRDNGITKSQVLKAHQFIEIESPEIHTWFRVKLDYAVEQGWLAAS